MPANTKAATIGSAGKDAPVFGEVALTFLPEDAAALRELPVPVVVTVLFELLSTLTVVLLLILPFADASPAAYPS
jgi:hypothetical protein